MNEFQETVLQELQGVKESISMVITFIEKLINELENQETDNTRQPCIATKPIEGKEPPKYCIKSDCIMWNGFECGIEKIGANKCYL